ncbi:MAG: class II aldolase/adducin family protein [Solirubrobacteraceae bacterium]
MSSDLSDLRSGVAAAARQLAAEGLVLGTGGNISARRGESVAITATGVNLSSLDPGEVTVVDLSGGPIAGDLAPSSELELHLGVYARFDAGAVVHTHAPMSTALSLVLDELPYVHYQMMSLGGSVRVAPYVTFGTPELAAVTLDALQDRTAALMANHGAIAFAEDLPGAIERSMVLEWACAVYWNAAAIGRPRILDEQQRIAAVRAARLRGYGTPHLRG